MVSSEQKLSRQVGPDRMGLGDWISCRGRAGHGWAAPCGRDPLARRVRLAGGAMLPERPRCLVGGKHPATTTPFPGTTSRRLIIQVTTESVAFPTTTTPVGAWLVSLGQRKEWTLRSGGKGRTKAFPPQACQIPRDAGSDSRSRRTSVAKMTEFGAMILKDPGAEGGPARGIPPGARGIAPTSPRTRLPTMLTPPGPCTGKPEGGWIRGYPWQGAGNRAGESRWARWRPR